MLFRSDADGKTLTVETLANGLVSIRSAKTEQLVNTQKRVLQSMTVFGDDGNVTLQRVFDAERDGNGAFVLHAIQDTSYEPVPNTNCLAVKKINQEFKNFKLTDFNGKFTLSK